VAKVADRADDKAVAGYKVTAAWVAELERRVAQLDAEVAALKKALRISKRAAAVKVVVNQPAAPAPPPPLPPTLDKALEQVQRPAVPEAPKP
jgi:uncharacterized small protein (DUF1192 family)